MNCATNYYTKPLALIVFYWSQFVISITSLTVLTTGYRLIYRDRLIIIKIFTKGYIDLHLVSFTLSISSDISFDGRKGVPDRLKSINADSDVRCEQTLILSTIYMYKIMSYGRLDAGLLHNQHVYFLSHK